MKRRTVITALLCASIISATLALAVAADTPYQDPEQRFTFAVPSGFVPLPASFFAAASDAFPGVEQVGYAAPSFPGATVVVSVLTDIPEGATLDTLAARNVLPPGFSPAGTGTQRITLGTLPAIRTESVGPPIGGRIRMLQITTFDGSAAYSLTFTARDADFAAFLTQAKNVADTFTLSAPKSAAGGAPIGPEGRFTDAAGRFSFAVPTGWKASLSTDEPIVVSLHFDKPAADASVAVEAFDPGESVSLDEYADAQRDAVAEEYPDQQQTLRTHVTFGGSDAVRAEYNVTRGGVATRIIHIIAIHGGAGYLLEFVIPQEAMPQLGPQVTALIDSWRFA